jgi:hypothetical protein
MPPSAAGIVTRYALPPCCTFKLYSQTTQGSLGSRWRGFYWHDVRLCIQGDTTKLKEYMKTLNLLPHKRKRKDAMLVKSPLRSPRLSPRSCLTGTAP